MFLMDEARFRKSKEYLCEIERIRSNSGLRDSASGIRRVDYLIERLVELGYCREHVENSLVAKDIIC